MQIKGIDKDTLERLEKAGYSAESLAVSTSDILSSKFEIDPEKAKKIIEAAQNQIGIHPVSALKFLELEAKRGKISTLGGQQNSRWYCFGEDSCAMIKTRRR